MSVEYQVAAQVEESVEKPDEILFHELELAIKWKSPLILFAIYDSGCVHIDAVIALEDQLMRLGHRVNRLQFGFDPNEDVMSKVSALSECEHNVLFVDLLHCEDDTDKLSVFQKLNLYREYFIEKQVKIVFWLTEKEIVQMASYAPDIWAFRHRVVDFGDSPTPEQKLPITDDTSWQDITAGEESVEDIDAKISLRESLLESLPEGDEAVSVYANLVLTLGILYWRKQDFDKAAELLYSALDIGFPMQDRWFDAQCFNAIALVMTGMGKIGEAIKAYKKAIHSAPNQVFPWNNLGNLYNKLNQVDKAVEAHMEALSHNPEDAVGWNGLGNAHQNAESFDEALRAYQKAIEFAPDFASPWNGLGDVYLKMDRLKDAVSAYSKATELDESFVDPWSALGEVFMDMDHIVDAIHAFQKVVDLDPGNFQAWVKLGDLHFRNKQYTEAISFYQKSIDLIELEEHQSNVWNKLGDAYRHLNEFDDATRAYQNADELSVQKNVMEELPSKGTQSNHQDEGEALMEKNRASDNEQEKDGKGIGLVPQETVERPESDASGNNGQNSEEESPEKGEPTMKKNIFSRALRGAVQAVNIQLSEVGQTHQNIPGDQEVVPLISLLEEEDIELTDSLVETSERDSAEAKNALNQPPEKVTVTESPDSAEPDEDVAYAEEEEAVLEVEEPAEAQAEADEDVETPEGEAEGLTAKSAYEWSELGNLYLKAGSYENAIEAYQKAIEMAPEFGWAYSNLGLVHYRQGQYEEAVSLYRKSIELFRSKEEKAISWNRLGDAFRGLGEYNNAMDAYYKADGYADTEGDREEIGDPDTTDTSGEESLEQEIKTGDSEATVPTEQANPVKTEAVVNESESEIEVDLEESESVKTPTELDHIDEDSTVETAKVGSEVDDGHEGDDRLLESGWPENTEEGTAGLADEEVEITKLQQNEIHQSTSDQVGPGVAGSEESASDEENDLEDSLEVSQDADIGSEEALSASDNGRDKTAVGWNELGNTYLRDGDYQKAIEAYQKAIDATPDFDWAYINNLALAYYQNGKHSEVVHQSQKETAQKANEVAPVDGEKAKTEEAVEVETLERETVDDTEQIEEIKSKAEVEGEEIQSSEAPDQPEDVNVETHLSEGEDVEHAEEEEAVLEVEEPAEAQAEADEDVETPEGEAEGLTAKSAYEWSELGNLYLKAGSYENAIEAYQKAIEMAPEFGWAYSNLGLVHYRQGQYEEAVSLYRKSIELFRSKEEKAISWNRLGNAYRRINEHQQAMDAYRIADELSMNVSSLLSRARLVLMNNE